MILLNLCFQGKFTPLSLEKELSDFEKKFGFLSDQSLENPSTVNIDLADVTFFDYGALGQLLLHVCRLMELQYKCVIVLQANGALDNSKNPWKFLARTRFCVALNDFAEVKKTHPPTFLLRNGVTLRVPDETLTYKNLVPFTWLTQEEHDKRIAIAKFLTGAVSHVGAGFSKIDARSLANVVIFELIENVSTHSGSQMGLLWANVPDLGFKTNSNRIEERDYLSWATEHHHSMVEVYVGDIGAGLVSSLATAYRDGPGKEAGGLTRNGVALPHRVLGWALDRWSSSKVDLALKRGVRGLYRVSRIAAAHKGQVSIRTHRSSFVHEYSVDREGTQKWNSAPKAYAHLGGTLISIRLLADFDDPFDRNATELKYSHLLGSMPTGVIELVNLDCEDKETIPESQKTLLIETLAKCPKHLVKAIVVSLLRHRFSKYGLEESLLFLLNHSHPLPIIVVGLTSSDSELLIAADSVLETIKKRNHVPQAFLDPHRDISAPVVILSLSKLAIYVGVEKSSVESVPQHAKQTFSRTVTKQLDVEVGPFQLLIKQSSEALSVLLKEGATQKTHGIKTEGNFLTPSLAVVSMWIVLPDFLKALSQFELHKSAFALALICESLIENQGDAFIVSQSENDSVLMKAMREYLGPRWKKIHADASNLSDVFSNSKDATVIAFTDIVSSGEAGRHVLQKIARAGMNARALVCLADLRSEPNSSISNWGRNVEVRSLFSMPTEIQLQPNSVVIPISPNNTSLETGELLRIDELTFLENDLGDRAVSLDTAADQTTSFSSTVSKGNWFNFGHSKRSNGRHLTFYANPESLLSSQEMVELAKVRLMLWLSGGGEEQQKNFDSADLSNLKVWVPWERKEGEDRREKLRRFLKLLTNGAGTDPFFIERQTIEGISAFSENDAPLIQSGERLLILDWGMVTGQSQTRLLQLAAEKGATDIMALALISQINGLDARFLSSLSSIAVLTEKPGQGSLWTKERITKIVRVRIEQCITGNFGFYSTTDCPVCRQVADLRAIEPRDQFLKQYLERSNERLWQEDYLEWVQCDENNVEKAEVVIGIAFLRELLSKALTKTADRHAILLYIKQIETSLKASSSLDARAFGLLIFLSLEDDWLRRPPLKYKPCRTIIANIALFAARNCQSKIKALSIEVLRKASKTRFLNEAAELFVSSELEEQSQSTILFGIYSFLSRSYHQSEPMLKFAEKTLKEIKEHIDKNPAAFQSAMQTGQFLNQKCKFLLRHKEEKERTTLDAFRDLKSGYFDEMYIHAPKPESLNILLANNFEIHLSELFHEHPKIAGKINSDLEIIHKLRLSMARRITAWGTCKGFLENFVAPLVIRTLEIFDRKVFHESLTSEQLSWWEDFLQDYQSTYSAAPKFSETIHKLDEILSLNPSMIDYSELRETSERYRYELSHLANIMLKAIPRNRQENSQKPLEQWPLLAAYMNQVPSNIWHCLEAARDEYVPVGAMASKLEDASDQSVGPSLLNIRVFCHKDLLDRVFQELFRNIGKYATQTPNSNIAVYRLRSYSATNCFTLEITNNVGRMTSPEKTYIHGLPSLNEELAKYGGKLSWTPPNGRENGEFVAALELKLWSN
jgi:hypothetical protein